MDNSLSLIVPVHNAEGSLGKQISRLLDVLSEMTQRFEVVIVDDASTDHTADVAAEISREYPQVTVVTQTMRIGAAAAARKGMARAKGEVVLTQDEIAGLRPSELHGLWTKRREQALRMAPSESHAGVFESPLINRLSNWGQSLQTNELASCEEELQRTRFGHAIDLHRAAPSHADCIPQVAQAQSSRTDASHFESQKARPVRSFLRHLREITLGE